MGKMKLTNDIRADRIKRLAAINALAESVFGDAEKHRAG